MYSDSTLARAQVSEGDRKKRSADAIVGPNLFGTKQRMPNV